MSDNFFQCLYTMSTSKKHMLKDDGPEKMDEKDYNPFMTNRAFSLHADSILFANAANQFKDVDNLLQYDFYFYGLPAIKRFSKWPKKEKIEDIEPIKNVYGYNNQRAKEALSILTTQQINTLKEKQETGGKS